MFFQKTLECTCGWCEWTESTNLNEWSQGKHLALSFLRHSLFPEGWGETKLSVSCGASHKVFSYTSQLKLEETAKKEYLLEAGWQTNLPRLQSAWFDHE